MGYVVNDVKVVDALEFYFLFDDIHNIRDIEKEAERAGLERPLRVLIELGYPGGRCGCRKMADALELAAYISNSRLLDLKGIEGFEGYIHASSGESLEAKIRSFLRDLIELTNACHDAGYFADGQTFLSVGGSAFYDLVFDESGSDALPEGCRVVTRSGCYLAHD